MITNPSIEDEIVAKVFTIVAATPESFTTQLSLANTSIAYYDSKINLEVVCAGLDGNVTLSQFQGLQNDVNAMSAINDTATDLPIVTTLTNGNYFLKSVTRAFFLGLTLDPLSATTGTVTVIIKA